MRKQKTAFEAFFFSLGAPDSISECLGEWRQAMGLSYHLLLISTVFIPFHKFNIYFLYEDNYACLTKPNMAARKKLSLKIEKCTTFRFIYNEHFY